MNNILIKSLIFGLMLQSNVSGIINTLDDPNSYYNDYSDKYNIKPNQLPENNLNNMNHDDKQKDNFYLDDDDYYKHYYEFKYYDDKYDYFKHHYYDSDFKSDSNKE